MSRDGEFDEETSWNLKDPEEKRYDFLPYFEDEEEQETMPSAHDATLPPSLAKCCISILSREFKLKTTSDEEHSGTR